MTRLCLAGLCCLVCFALFPLLSARATQPDPFERLFGYQAVPAAGPQDFPVYLERHWTRVLKEEQNKPCLQRTTSCLPSADASQWLYLAGKAPVMDEMTRLRTVSSFFNKFPSASDRENYGVEDHWPTLAEFFSRRSGDCKAYALAKYFALRALGTSDDKLRIVIVHIPARKANHAMLAVDTAKGVFILDNNMRPLDLILPQEKLHSQFVPFFMINEKGRWTFNQDTKLLHAGKVGQEYRR